MRALLLALLCLLPALPTLAQTETPPDIIVILLDDMRADDWPVLEPTRRLVGGTFFENFIYNTPVCCPFRASFQTGQLAHNTGVKKNHDGAKFPPHDADTIATALSDAGYFTAYIGKYMNNYRGTAPGWDVWERIAHDQGKPAYWEGKVYITEALTADALRAIADVPPDRPLFLMLGHVAPHNPSRPSPAYKTADVGATISSDDARRKRTLLSVNDSTAAIAAAMGERWDDAVVVVLSDNGYLLGEHHTKGKSIWWDEATRVPMLLRAPGITPGTDRRLTSTVDVPATLLRAAGAAVNHPLDGRPLQQSWTREAVLVESWAKGSSGEKRLPFTALKGEDWIYVEPKGRSARYYTMPGEEANLIHSLTESERRALADTLAALRDCAGDGCG